MARRRKKRNRQNNIPLLDDKTITNNRRKDTREPGLLTQKEIKDLQQFYIKVILQEKGL